MSEREAGYTLVEMLTALTVLGLALGALSQATVTLGRQQRAALTAQSSSALQAELRAALAPPLAAASAPQALHGDANHISWPCGVRTCQAQLTGKALRVEGAEDTASVGIRQALQFLYVDAEGAHRSWPPARRSTLLTLLVAPQRTDVANPETIVSIALASEQPLRCDYDSIAMRCLTD